MSDGRTGISVEWMVARVAKKPKYDVESWIKSNLIQNIMSNNAAENRKYVASTGIELGD